MDDISLIADDSAPRPDAEFLLKEQAARYRSILDAAGDAVVTTDDEGIIVQVNRAAVRMFGYAEAEMIGNNVQMLMPPSFRQQHHQYLQRYLKTGEKRIIGASREAVAQRKDGSTFPIELIISEFQDGRRYFTGIMRDITDRKTLQAEILRIAEEERRHIGEELHDDIQQQLTGMLLMARHIAKSLHRPEVQAQLPPDIVARADHLTEGLRETSQKVRALSHQLVPAQILGQGLRESLTNLIAEVNNQQAVECSLAWNSAVDLDDPFAAMHLYRIAQEAIHNALKHAQARRIDVECRLADDLLELRIADDGIGLEPVRPARGRGFSIMEYRAGVIGGVLTIHPGETRGTVVQCKVPLNSLKALGDNRPLEPPAALPPLEPAANGSRRR